MKKPSEMTESEIVEHRRQVLARAARQGHHVAFGAPIKVEIKSSPRRAETFVRTPSSTHPCGLTDRQMQICREQGIDPARYAAVRDGAGLFAAPSNVATTGSGFRRSR